MQRTEEQRPHVRDRGEDVHPIVSKARFESHVDLISTQIAGEMNRSKKVCSPACDQVELRIGGS